MVKKANLEFEDAFAWGVWQKIRLTGERTITFNEIKQFAQAVKAKASAADYQLYFQFGRDLFNQFRQQYREYVTEQDDALTLNDNVSYQQALEIFPMGVLTRDLIELLLDDSIGQQVFSNQENNKGPKKHHLALNSTMQGIKIPAAHKEELSR